MKDDTPFIIVKEEMKRLGLSIRQEEVDEVVDSVYDDAKGFTSSVRKYLFLQIMNIKC